MSLEHERKLIAQTIIDNTILDSEVVADDFGDPFCHNLYSIMGRLREAKTPIDLVSIRDADPKIQPQALAQLSDETYSAANWRYYADEVLKGSRSRKLERIGKALAQEAAANPDTAAENAERALMTLSHTGKKYDIASPKEYIPEWIKYYQKMSSMHGIPGIRTGFNKMDSCFGGFNPRRYYIIGGRPSDGKSALLMQLSMVAAALGNSVGIISAESAREELYSRFVSHSCRIDGRRMFNVDLMTGHEKTSIMQSLSAISDDNAIHIWDKPNPQLREVVSVARHMKIANDIAILLVDYIQLIQVQGARDRTEAAAITSLGLKALSRELDIPVVAAAQLRRDDENKRPHIGSFQWADQLGQDADVAMLLWHKDKGSDNEKSCILLEKVRDGKTGEIDVTFERDVVTFKELRN